MSSKTKAVAAAQAPVRGWRAVRPMLLRGKSADFECEECSMSKQAKGTLTVWLSSGSYTKPSELHKLDDKELVGSVQFQNIDMSRDGWTRVGTAEVIITLDDCKTCTANQVAILQSQLQEMRAEHQQAQNRLTKQIHELLAIDNEVQE